jgi:hypothetical protein
MSKSGKLLGYTYFEGAASQFFSVAPVSLFWVFQLHPNLHPMRVANLVRSRISWSMVKQSGVGCHKGTPGGHRQPLWWLGMGIKIYPWRGRLVSELFSVALGLPQSLFHSRSC